MLTGLDLSVRSAESGKGAALISLPLLLASGSWGFGKRGIDLVVIPLVDTE